MAKYSFLPCFVGRNVNDVIKGFIERFHIEKTDVEFNKFVEGLIYDSMNSWRTYQYDLFQELTNGILQ
jgi:phosphatidylinositol kinase/protein kinase (PI-3  family)